MTECHKFGVFIYYFLGFLAKFCFPIFFSLSLTLTLTHSLCLSLLSWSFLTLATQYTLYQYQRQQQQYITKQIELLLVRFCIFFVFYTLPIPN